MRKKASKHKRPVCRNCQKHRQSLVGFAFIGLMHDVTLVIRGLVKLVSWPVKVFSHWLAVESRKYPELKWMHTHTFWSVVMGLCLVFVSFAIQNVCHHFIWEATIETIRAGGVCPIWEVVASLSKVANELEG